MKNMMTAVAALVLLAAAPSANAISLRFKFKTFSSGPNIYACNAGIAAPNLSKQVCYKEGTKETCNASQACTDTAQNCNTRCVCTSTNGGDWLMNYGKATYGTWKDNGTPVSYNSTPTSFSAHSQVDGWAQLFPSDVDSWGKQIKELSFNLGSELYGAAYFVDICYRGPQIEYKEDGVASNFSLTAQTTATDFFTNIPVGDDRSGANGNDFQIPGTVDGLKYTDLADLKVISYVGCDFQGKGNFQWARNNQGRYNTTDNEADFNLAASGDLNGLKLPFSNKEGSSSFWSSDLKKINADGGALISNLYITNNSLLAPRFCKVRYVFVETDANKSAPNLRKWQRHGAEMCTWTDIVEGVQN